jgi:hypothetical protein
MQSSRPASIELKYEQMPLWMRRSQQRFDWGVVFALLIGLLAAWPFFSHSQLSMTNSQLQAVFRTADTAVMLREGRLYPRWSPHAFGGYGAPIPNYEPPGASYLAAVIEVLFTDDTQTAVRITYILALIVASIGMYLLVTRWSNCTQGLLAAALYTLSPTIGLTLPHLDGNLPLVISTVLLPLTLWTFDRLLNNESALDLLYVAGLVGLQLLIDPRILPVTALWSTALFLIHHRRQRLPAQIIGRSAAAWLGGISIACMFWLPAFAESSLVAWRSQPIATSPLPIALSQLFQAMHAIDPTQLKPPGQFTLGLPLWITFATGVGALLIKRWQGSAVFRSSLILTLLLTGLLILWIPSAHWLMLPMTFGAAISGSLVIRVLDFLPDVPTLTILRRMIPPLLIGGLLVASHPIWLAPAPNIAITSVTPNDQVRYEQLTGRTPLLPSDAKRPTTLPAGIESNPLLINSYAFTTARSFDTLSKIVPAQLTRNGQLNIVWQHTHESLFRIPDDQNRIRQTPPANTRSPSGQIESETGAPAFTWLTPYFPGWQATLEGETLNITTEPTSNLIRVELPPGSSGALLLQLTPTTTQAASWGVSGTAFVILMLLTRLALRYDDPERRINLLRYMQAAELRLFTVLMVCFALIFAYLNITPEGNLLRAAPGEGLRAATPIRVQTNVGLQLFGYRIEASETLQPGGKLQLDLYWRVLRALPENYWVRVSLNRLSAESTASSIILAEKMPGDLPTRLWPTERYVQDSYSVALPQDLSAGTYLLGLEVFACNTPACDTTSPSGQVALFVENTRTSITRVDLPEFVEIRP